tara:strand:+ start:1779 stop:1982 length:204 start_codon:yes stop_codon:yes gene_type:complete
MKNILYILLLVLIASCSKDELICGTIDSGGIDLAGLLYLRVDGQKIWVDQKTYESYYVGDYECFEDY